MNDYEIKQEERRQRYIDAADRARRKAESLRNSASSKASQIPFGQPILVGHHSEGRDRRFRDGIARGYERSMEESEKADHYQQKAASTGQGGISADDPEAVAKLTEQLGKLEKLQEKMKAINICVRKNNRAGIAAFGYSEQEVQRFFVPDCMNRIGIPSYVLTNNNANIRRIRERIQSLEKSAQREAKSEETEKYTYEENTDENRVMFIFPGIPAEDVRSILKQYAFKWSMSRGAWVRQLTPNAIYAAKMVRQFVDK